MGAVQTLKCPIADGMFFGVDGTESRDKYIRIDDAMLTTAGSVVVRPSFNRVGFTGAADGTAATLVKPWPKANGTVDHLLMIEGARVVMMDNNYGSPTKTVVSTTYASTLVKNHCTRAWDGSTLYMFLTNNTTKPNYMAVSFAALNTCAGGVSIPTGSAEYSLGFLDGYLLAANHAINGGSQFYYSNLLTALTWAGKAAQAVGSPDNLLRMHVWDRQIWLFGEDSIEIWENDGTSPFSRVSGGYLTRGVANANSMCRSQNDVYILDNDRTFGRIRSGTFEPILTPTLGVVASSRTTHKFAQDSILTTLPAYQRELIVVDEPSAYTWVYDPLFNSWYLWGLRAIADPIGIRDACSFNGYTYVACGGVYGGIQRLGEVSTGTHNDAPSTNTETFVNPHVAIYTGHIDYGTTKQKRSHELRIRMRPPSGNATGTLTIKMYDDQKATATYTHTYSLGANNEAGTVLRVYCPGAFRTRQYELTFSDNYYLVISHAEEDIEVLD